MPYTAIFNVSLETASSSGSFTNTLSAGGLRQEVLFLHHFNSQLKDVNSNLSTEAIFNLSFTKLRLMLLTADAPMQYSIDSQPSWSVAARTHAVQLGASDLLLCSQLKVRYGPVLQTPPATVNFEILVAGV